MSDNNAFEIRNVLIIPNLRKPGITGMVRHVASWLERNGVGNCILADDVEALGPDAPAVAVARLEAVDLAVDLAVVLGGDGTMLHAVDVLWGHDIPLIGINIGKLGFLTAAEMHQVDRTLEDILAGRFLVSRRLSIGCRLGKEGGREFRALNEVVIGKLARERLIHLSTYINGEFFMRYSGDGLIISSATGSTAYSLSSGGPIVTPELNCFLMTPICAHMLFSRPMVLDAGDTVKVIIGNAPERLALSVDGREDVEVPPGATIEFFAMEKTVKIIELEGSSFYQTLRRKFMSPPAYVEDE